MTTYISAAEALAVVQSGNRVFVHGGAATPLHLLRSLQEQRDRLENVELTAVSMQGEPIITEADRGHFFINSLFVSPAVRKLVNTGMGDYIPVFLSEIPKLFRQGYLKIDVALVQVSPPDRHGFCTLGVSVDVVHAALESAKFIIAQVNPKMPRTHGDSAVHKSVFTSMVWQEEELPQLSYATDESDEVSKLIGAYCASIIEDGATLQMGIGSIPDAVLKCLNNHRHLGVHTEMFSDGIIPLVESGVIDGSRKKIMPGKLVTGFLVGTQKLYDFVNDNPSVAVRDIDFVNDTAVIRRNPKVAAINSALEIDLTGQICADSLGMYQFSGVGGQMDFIRGASLSEGGKPIIALPSSTNKGESKIVPMLKAGASVTTTRAHVHYVVTEYGIADLYGKNLHQRANALIAIAHPNHREALQKQVFERFKY
jgi:acyl-CoA hydrolase